MELSWMDIGIFVLFFLIVVGVSMYKSRHEAIGSGSCHKIQSRNLSFLTLLSAGLIYA